MSAERRPGRGPGTGWRRELARGLAGLPPRVHRVVPPEVRDDLRHRLDRNSAWEGGYDLSPPPPGPGETVGPPDVVGLGVQMAGVRWWFGLVSGHPGVADRRDIAMDRHYLSHFATAAFGDEEIARYHGWFPRRAGTIAGEWTPSYLAQPWVPPLLARAAPEARILILVRDPVERLCLGLARSGEARRANAGVAIADAVDRGFYAGPLRRVLEYFPPDRVLTLQYERCRSDPAGQLATTFRFLGLDDASGPRTIPPPDGPGADLLPALDPDTRHRLTELYAADVADLATLVPDLDLSLWAGFTR